MEAQNQRVPHRPITQGLRRLSPVLDTFLISNLLYLRKMQGFKYIILCVGDGYELMEKCLRCQDIIDNMSYKVKQ